MARTEKLSEPPLVSAGFAWRVLVIMGVTLLTLLVLAARSPA